MKKDLKKNILPVIIMIINFGIAYLITSILGVRNVTLYKSIGGTYILTYEVIIWLILSLIFGYFYDKQQKKDEV